MYHSRLRCFEQGMERPLAQGGWLCHACKLVSGRLLLMSRLLSVFVALLPHSHRLCCNVDCVGPGRLSLVCSLWLKVQLGREYLQKTDISLLKFLGPMAGSLPASLLQHIRHMLFCKIPSAGTLSPNPFIFEPG